MSGTKLNPTNASTITINNVIFTVLDQYYVNGQAYMNLKDPNGLIRKGIPADGSAANPPNKNGQSGQHGII